MADLEQKVRDLADQLGITPEDNWEWYSELAALVRQDEEAQA